jgi:hypothetical protein
VAIAINPYACGHNHGQAARQYHDHLSDHAVPRDIACALSQDYFGEIVRMIRIRWRTGLRRMMLRFIRVHNLQISLDPGPR